MRIAIANFSHESNTFAAKPTRLEDFEIYRGQAMIDHYAPTFHEIAGYIAGAEEYDFDLHATLGANATPSGTVTREAYETITGEILANLRAANADFDAALAMDPNEPEAWLNKAVGHAKFGRSIDALPLAEKALALNTRRPALAYFVRAMALEDGGNIVGAYRDLRRARALEPKWKEPAIELRRFQVRQAG